MKTRSLRQRIAISLTFFSALVAIPLILVGDWVNELAEQEFWQAMLSAELAHSGPDRPPSANAHGLLDSYRWEPGSAQESVVPPEIRELHPGLHDNIQHQGRELAVLVQESDGMRSAASIDITNLEEEEATLSAWAVTTALLALTLLLIALNWLAKRAIEPVTQLSKECFPHLPSEPPVRAICGCACSITCGGLSSRCRQAEGSIGRSNDRP